MLLAHDAAGSLAPQLLLYRQQLHRAPPCPKPQHPPPPQPQPQRPPPPAPHQPPPVFADRFFSVAAADALHSAAAALAPLDHEARDRDQKLAEKLKVRLRFAAFKIRRGWQDCTVEEVKRQCQARARAKRTPFFRAPAVAPFAETTARARRSADNAAGRAAGRGGPLLPLPATWHRAEQLGAAVMPRPGVGPLDEKQTRPPPTPPPPIVPVQHSEELAPTSAAALSDFGAANGHYPALKYYAQSTGAVAATEANDADLAGCGPVLIWEDNLTHSPADELSSTINPFYNARELMVISPVPTPARPSRSSSSYNSPVQLVFPEQGDAPCDGSEEAAAAAAAVAAVAAASSSQYADSAYALSGEFLCSLETPGLFRPEADYAALPVTAAQISPPPGAAPTTPEAAAALLARLDQPQDHNWATASPRHCSLYSDVPAIPVVGDWSSPASRPA